MAKEFNVIGERKDDDLHLLVRGEDGKHYDYSLTSEQVSPVDPDERWTLDREPDDDGSVGEGEGGELQPESGSETPVG